MMKRYDLHCHSVYSDGSETPKALAALAKSAGLSGLAITDHDSFDAFFELEKEDIACIPGIELSCEAEQKSIHILGYAFDPYDREFAAFCQKQRDYRRERLEKMCALLTEHGLPLTVGDVASSDDPRISYGRVHVALALLKKGYITNPSDAFKRYIGDKAPCYVAGKRCSVDEGIDAIHKAKGFAVLAHPHLIDSKSLVRRLLAKKFDGLEGYYSRFSYEQNQHWVQRAKEKGRFVTGGSDFHGVIKPDVSLGVSFCPEEVYAMIDSHYRQKIQNPA